MLNRWHQQMEDWLWQEDLDAVPAPRRWWLSSIRLGYLLMQDLADPQFTLRVMGLVYTTLLSLVPFLALGFSLLKAFGVHNLIEPILANVLQPLGGGAAELTNLIIGFVENVKVGILGSVGLALLLFAAISLIQKVENGFNYIWQVRRSRNLVRRISEYFSVLTISPLMLALIIGLTASMMSNRMVQHIIEIEPFGSLMLAVGRVLPALFTCIAFAFLYLFIPNTRVRVLPALAAGLFAGLAWQSASWIFAKFAGNLGSYSAVYSGFAVVILLLIWLYVCWMILLMGCHVAFLLQNSAFLTRRHSDQHMGSEMLEHLALLIMALVARNFIEDRPPWRAAALAKHTRLPPRHVYQVIELLLAQGYLTEAGMVQPHLLPERDLSSISIQKLMRDIRSSDAELRLDRSNQHPYNRVTALLDKLQASQDASLKGLTLRDFASEPLAASETKPAKLPAQDDVEG